MITRDDLEQWKTADEMRHLIDQALDSAPTRLARARREGLVKEITEEYEPLWRLIRHRPGALVKLTPKGNDGPDALVRENGGEQSVQVTLAGASEQTYLNRIAALEGRPFFPAQTKVKVKGVLRVRGTGRALQSPLEIVKKGADAIMLAIQKKSGDHSQTDLLLVVYDQHIPKRLRTALKRRVRTQWASNQSRQHYRKVVILIGDARLSM